MAPNGTTNFTGPGRRLGGSSPSTLTTRPRPAVNGAASTAKARTQETLLPNGKNLKHVNPELDQELERFRKRIKADTKEKKQRLMSYKKTSYARSKGGANFPQEIITMFWKYLCCADAGRIINFLTEHRIELREDPRAGSTLIISEDLECGSESLLPVAFRICKESRSIALSHYELLHPPSHPNGIYINWATDVFVFGQSEDYFKWFLKTYEIENTTLTPQSDARALERRQQYRPLATTVSNKLQRLALHSNSYAIFEETKPIEFIVSTRDQYFGLHSHFQACEELFYIRPTNPEAVPDLKPKANSLVRVNHDCKFLKQTQLRVRKFANRQGIESSHVVDLFGESKGEAIKEKKAEMLQKKKAAKAKLLSHNTSSD